MFTAGLFLALVAHAKGCRNQVSPRKNKGYATDWGHGPEPTRPTEREPVKRTREEHDTEAPRKNCAAQPTGFGGLLAATGEEQRGSEEHDRVEQMILHPCFPRREVTRGEKLRLERMGPEGSANNGEQTEHSSEEKGNTCRHDGRNSKRDVAASSMLKELPPLYFAVCSTACRLVAFLKTQRYGEARGHLVVCLAIR